MPLRAGVPEPCLAILRADGSVAVAHVTVWMDGQHFAGKRVLQRETVKETATTVEPEAASASNDDDAMAEAEIEAEGQVGDETVAAGSVAEAEAGTWGLRHQSVHCPTGPVHTFPVVPAHSLQPPPRPRPPCFRLSYSRVAASATPRPDGKRGGTPVHPLAPYPHGLVAEFGPIALIQPGTVVDPGRKMGHQSSHQPAPSEEEIAARPALGRVTAVETYYSRAQDLLIMGDEEGHVAVRE